MSDGTELRPDGREFATETAELRRATRALRGHLDELPIDFDLSLSGDGVLAGLAFESARLRYDCADSMIGAGFGGTVLGALARSLFADGLRWLWVANKPQRRRRMLGDLAEERQALRTRIDEEDCTCPILSRWLMPLPDVADLAGASGTWHDTPTTPGEAQLLDDFLAGPPPTTPLPACGQDHAALLRRTGRLLDLPGLRGAAMVLKHAGHGNHLGLQSCLTVNGTPGHDLRADHEALFMQVAAAGVTATLLGGTASTPELWPADIERDPFLERAVDLATVVAEKAMPIHLLATNRRRLRPSTSQIPDAPVKHLRPGAILGADDLLPERASLGPVVAAVHAYTDAVGDIPYEPDEREAPTLHTVLEYAAGTSGLQTVLSTYDQPGSAVIAVFAARMVLEEAARVLWRFRDPAPAAFKARAKQFFDEYRVRRKKAISHLHGNGVPRANAERLFELPPFVRIEVPLDRIAKGRVQLPSISSMLRQMGDSFHETGWLVVAYSLLSQITHSTPLGRLHTLRFRDGVLHGGALERVSKVVPAEPGESHGVAVTDNRRGLRYLVQRPRSTKHRRPRGHPSGDEAARPD